MPEFTVSLQGTSPTVIGATDFLQFANDIFGSRITVGQYNNSTHVESSVGANDSSGNTPNNVKFISQTGGTGGDSQGDWGDGTEDIDQITDAEATLKINFATDGNVSIEDAIIYAFDGTTPATPPTGVDVRMFEVGDNLFTQAEGNAAALELADQTTPADSHDYFIGLSLSPTQVGQLSGKLRLELSYY